MDIVEGGMVRVQQGLATLLDNHMTHIQQSLTCLAEESVLTKQAIVERDARLQAGKVKRALQIGRPKKVLQRKQK